MPLNIVVCAKQVVDPEMPASAFKVDSESKKVVPAAGLPPVINGFDENAVEAALRLKETLDGKITVISMGSEFAMDVIKKPLSMGADELILVQDDAVEDLDSSATAYALTEAIKKVGEFDLVLCGRQASDWDNAQVPIGIAVSLGLPCITLARKVEVADGKVIVERALPDGYEVVEASLPALVTVSNELGEPRYPTLRGIMGAARIAPTVWSTADLGLDAAQLAPKILLTDLFIPVAGGECEIIEGEDEGDAGRKLALRLREENLI
jgi:electron transfer flavoprotein beta subunit